MRGKNEKISVCFYDFMYELGLRGSALTIYAFIYAYRRSKMGFFFGKRQLIADKCKISLRTVERAIPKLLRLGLVEYVEAGEYKGLRVIEDKIPEKYSIKPEIEYGYDALDDEEAPLRTDIKPKYDMVTLGKYVTMTREQSEALLSLVPIRELESYAAKMDRMLENNMASGIRPPKNYYKTMKKWILDDCKL